MSFMKHIALAGVLISLATAGSVHRRAAIDGCLANFSVPVDTKGSSTWNADIKPFNPRLTYTPVAVAVPTTIAQIQAAVNCGRLSGVKVTAKSGGHSYASFGLGGEDGHLMIELDRMFNVTVNSTTNIAIVQPGARLGHVTNQLYSQGGRAISAGTCPGVGVSGHSLHGGYGMSSHKYGLATDWIVGMTVVLANGTIVHTSATEKPDLFWALRGAGSNFGIVAQYEFNTFAAPSQVTYFNMNFRWNTTTAPGNLAALENYTKTFMPADLTMRAFVSSGSSYFEGMFFGNATGLRAALQPLQDKTGLVLASTTTTTFLNAFSHYANAATDPTTPYSFQQTFYSKSLMLKGLNGTAAKNFVNYWYNVGPTNRRGWWFQLDLHGGAFSGVTNGDHSLSSYAHRDKLYLIQFYDQVYSGSYPSDGYPFLDNFVSNTTASLAASDWGMYINYADNRLSQTAAQNAYYGSSLPRLQKLKYAYDSGLTYTNPQGILPVA
ncbi:hypothetical protein LTR95_002053 [Oleoguttula sp. CCFEE 5521]